MCTGYVKEVSTLFKGHCGKTILSPDDYAMIAEWEKQEIPFDVVAMTIDLTMATLADETQIDSIDFFDEPVKAIFRRWLQMQSRPSKPPSDKGH